MEYRDFRLALWEDPVQRDEVTSWVEERLAERGVRLLPQPPRVRVRPWSSTARFASTAGPVWFKANAPGSEFEAALVGALRSWVPGRVLSPWGVDAKRGWTLLPEGGTALRDQMVSLDDTPVWEGMLASYAELQRCLSSSGRVRDLVALDVPDLRPGNVDRHVGSFLTAPGVARALGNDHKELEQRRSRIAADSATLREGPLPCSLDHTDLHVGNVFLTEGGYRFFDWGDAAVAHPLGSLLVPLRFLRGEVGNDTRALERLRDAYLEPWTATAPVHELRRLVAPALRLGAVARAVAWSRAFPELLPQTAETQNHNIAYWLRTAAGMDDGPL
ncbi:phosphotransferase [Haloactinospora alba]|uniref:phosphotransferase n=1 Tax=Haloactinospora alba TaxID=405555 RepID=UPI001FE3AF6A|nr:phosphotransferase [Haloactinospora alba]